ncbi:DUF2127 domain-containing protein [Pseudorhodoferax sp. Leaf274]|uniref:DUF2127 domain-containing protein n=1 Tax=Pseudorhodoferax sp. Leaf274 TaxID=1736318 RepID=UPI001F17676B|nr:DUF2127 domain-containing protein [Pseudorhodoferax sp. Leaf274]
MNTARPALRTVALFEAAKGLLALVGASGLLAFAHRDLQALALQMLAHLHMNPAAHYPHIFVQAAEHLQDQRLALLALGAAGYALLRLGEAYGLWRGRAWAEWLAAGSGAIYLPFEVAELLRRPGWLSASLLLLNAGIVVLMLRALRQRGARPRWRD